MLATLFWTALVGARAGPEQVHLAYGRSQDSMTVAWVTQEDVVGTGTVEFGEAAAVLSSEAGADTRPFTQDTNRTWFTHVASMSALKPNTQYFYRVGGLGEFSQVFRFTHRRTGAPYKHVIMGDMGASNAFSLCLGCTGDSLVCDAATCAANTSVGLVGEISDADMILHTGDFAYDLDSDNGRVGDQFMRNIEQVAAYVPYMVSHGNHEDSDNGLAHFIERFRHMPSNAAPATFKSTNGETTNSLYFSWDAGLIHYVSISTEIYFAQKWAVRHVNVLAFTKWLKADLAKANANREQVPWIVVQGHRSIYCSCDSDCGTSAEPLKLGLEGIFFNYGVDFYINGHEHNYERSFPIHKGKSDRSSVDPKSTIYIVSGAAGSREMHEPFTRDQPTWSAFRSDSFGYSVLWAHNATHIHWQQIQTDPTQFPGSDYGRVIDDAWIIQHNHGPFKLSEAPSGEAYELGASVPGRQHEHWWPLLELGELTTSKGVTSERAIQAFRESEGEAAWAKKLDGLMGWVAEHLGSAEWKGNATVVWEDVREDGSSDCATCDRNGTVVALV